MPAAATSRPSCDMTPAAVDPPAHLLEPTARIDAFLLEYVRSLSIPASLREAVEYALVGGGKRLRPLLAWHCCAAVGAHPESSLPAGAAVEFIHAFSLVHDDLPGLDNDDLRRGRPTLHKFTSEAMAILAGDAMLNMAFQVLVDRIAAPELTTRLVAELAWGTSGMIAGQVYDTLGGFGPGLSDQQRLSAVHNNKTGALIRASCRMGAMSGLPFPPTPGGEKRLAAITGYAEAIGLMFQVVDDIIDVTQPATHAGKKTNKDQDAGKLTYPGVLGLEQSRAEVQRLLAVAMDALAALGEPARPLRELASYMAVRTK